MTNLLLIALALLAQSGGGGVAPGVGQRMDLRDKLQGPTPVTDKFLLPPKIPDCRTQAEVDTALADKRQGYFERCDPERFLKAH